MNQIPDKKTFLELSNRGLLGNRLATYETLAHVSGRGTSEYYAIRARDKQSPWHRAFVHSTRLQNALNEIWAQGGPSSEAFFFQDTPPPDVVRPINLEAGVVAGKMWLTIEFKTKEPVRGIRERGQVLNGLEARVILRYALRDESWEMLSDIWERYPESIIEATEFPTRQGFDQKHLVCWEVRDY